MRRTVPLPEIEALALGLHEAGFFRDLPAAIAAVKRFPLSEACAARVVEPTCPECGHRTFAWLHQRRCVTVGCICDCTQHLRKEASAP